MNFKNLAKQASKMKELAAEAKERVEEGKEKLQDLKGATTTIASLKLTEAKAKNQLETAQELGLSGMSENLQSKLVFKKAAELEDEDLVATAEQARAQLNEKKALGNKVQSLQANLAEAKGGLSANLQSKLKEKAALARDKVQSTKGLAEGLQSKLVSKAKDAKQNLVDAKEMCAAQILRDSPAARSPATHLSRYPRERRYSHLASADSRPSHARAL